jgi:signal transduction histidine kinase
VRSYLAVPVTSRSGEIFGELSFGHACTDVFTDRAEQIVIGLAAQAAIAMDNARLYLEAQQAIRTRDQFLSIAAHELKTPLTTMLGYAQLLLERVAREGTSVVWTRNALHTVYEQGLRIDRLVAALLDLSRIQTGTLTLDRSTLDLAQLVATIVAEIQPILDRHVLHLQLPPMAVLVSGDELRLEQVVQNLVQNAIKYSPSGGPVSVSVDCTVGAEGETQSRVADARIIVRDRGIGIPVEAMPKLFDRFFRAENATAQPIGGLGLYVVNEIVALHGGTVEVESVIGFGSTFTVRLPLLNGQDQDREPGN